MALLQEAQQAAPVNQAAPFPPAPTGGQAPGGPAPGGQAPGGITSDSPEFKQAMQVASNALYDEQVFSDLVEQAKAGKIVEALSTTAALIVTETESATGALALDGAVGLLLLIIVDGADALSQVGVEIDEATIFETISSAIELFLQQNHGRWSKEEIEAVFLQMQQEAEQLAAGGLDQVLPTPEGGAPAGPAPGGQPAAPGGLLSQGGV